MLDFIYLSDGELYNDINEKTFLLSKEIHVKDFK